MEEDRRDRQKEREEIETLRLEVMERQHRQIVANRDDEESKVRLSDWLVATPTCILIYCTLNLIQCFVGHEMKHLL